MHHITQIYAYYWIVVYLVILSVALYGYRKLRLNYNRRSALKYFGTLLAINAIFWAIWTLGSYFSGGASAEFIKLSLAHQAAVFIIPAVILSWIFGMIIFVTQLSRSRSLRATSFGVIFLILFITVGGILNSAESVPSSFEPLPFPAGEKADYLNDYIKRENLPAQLFVVDSPYANAWVSVDHGNQNVNFTLPAVQALTKEELLSVMTHELGHKFAPHDVMFFKRNQKPIGYMIGILYLGILSGLYAYALKRPGSSAADIMQLKVKDGDKPGNDLVFSANRNRFPFEAATVLVLICICWLPSLTLDNFIVRIEERHADAVSIDLLNKYNVPLKHRADSLSKMVRTNNADGDDNKDWLYLSWFSDHPATSDRIALINSYNK